jgi:hypothetical protein
VLDLGTLVSEGQAAGLEEALRRWGPGPFSVRGQTRRGCCVHLVVERDGAEVARWRYELDKRIVDDCAGENAADPPPNRLGVMPAP